MNTERSDQPESDLPTLGQLATCTEAELLKLHGVGPNALAKLRSALAERGLSFKNPTPFVDLVQQ